MADNAGRITLWGVEVFIATAEERSITAAARRLGASPSAVSQQLTNLEGAMGVTLLQRNARPILLTPAGEIFRRRAQNIMNEAEQVRTELAMSDMRGLTRFRLGMIEDLAADVTPQLLTQMADELTTCQFLLETGASHFLHDQLDARALDVIVAAEMGEALSGDGSPPAYGGRVCCCGPKARLTARRCAASVEALPLIQYTSRHHMGRQIASHLSRQNLRMSHRFELDSYHAILAMVGQGAGWTILTPLALMRARRFAPKIDVMALPFEPLSRRISLTAREGILQDMPEGVAQKLRPILRQTIIDPALEAFPETNGVISLL